MPVDGEFHTYLVGQYRFPLQTYSWEIPEGGGPLDCDPQVTAARELVERHYRWEGSAAAVEAAGGTVGPRGGWTPAGGATRGGVG